MVSERYRLELYWNTVEKTTDNRCILHDAFFCGPALKIAQRINPKDHITLDLTPHYSKIITSFYFAEINWSRADHKNDMVILGDVIVESPYINSISNLNDLDFIRIDTSQHEEEIHVYNFVYKAEIFTKEKEKKL